MKIQMQNLQNKNKKKDKMYQKYQDEEEKQGKEQKTMVNKKEEEDEEKVLISKGVAYFQLIYISICFLLILASLNPVSNIIIKIYNDLGYDGLGQVQMFMIYLANCISNFFAPFIYKKLDMSLAYKLPSFGFLLMILGNIAAGMCYQDGSYFFCQNQVYIWLVQVLFSFIWGFSIVYLWLASSMHISLIASQEQKGQFFGIFNLIVQSSYIVGYTFILLVLPHVQYVIFFLIFFGIVVLAEILFLLIPIKQALQKQKLQLQKKKTQYEEERIKLKQLTTEKPDLTNLLQNFQKSSDEEEVLEPDTLDMHDVVKKLNFNGQQEGQEDMDEGDVSLKGNVNNIIKCFKGRKVRAILPLMFSNGLNLAFNAGFLSSIIKASFASDISTDDSNTKILYVLLGFGIAESISGIITGYLVDRIPLPYIYIMNYLLTWISIGYTFFMIHLENYTYMFALGAAWGYTDGCNQTSTPALISKTFGASTEPFAIFRLLNGISYMIGMIVSLSLENEDLYVQVGVYSVFFVLAMVVQVRVGCGGESSSKKDKKDKKSKKKKKKKKKKSRK